MSLTLAAATLIGAGIAGTSALATHFANSRHQKKMLEKTNKLNRENWQLENSYNSPSAQMARLRAAGLNPNLIYQNGAPSASGSIESPQAGQNVADYSGIASGALEAFKAQNQQDQTAQYIDFLKAQGEKATAETEGIRSDNIMKAAKSDFADRFAKYELRSMAYNATMMDAQTNLYNQQAALVEQQTGIAEQDRLNYGMRFGFLMRDAEDKHMISQATYNEINFRISKIAQDISESRFRSALASAETKVARQQVKNMKADFESVITQNIRAEIAMELEQMTADWLKTSAGKDGSFNRPNQTHLDKQLKLALDQLERDYQLSPLNSVGGLFRDIGIGVGGFMQLKGSFGKRNPIGFNH